EYIKDLNSIPWPAYDLLNKDPKTYRGMPHDSEGMTRPVAVMMTTRGCPHRCAFCSLGSKMYRERDVKDVVDEMEFYKNKFGANSIQLYDDEFIGMSTKQNERIEALCAEIIGRGLNKKLKFLVQGRCSQFVDLDTLKKMKEAGIIWIWWGVESGSPKILDFIHKDITIENVKRTFTLTKKAGIKRLMFIMIGFPKETPEDIKMTADLIEKTKPDQTRIHICSPYPGSELRKYLEDHNLLDNADYYSFDTRLTVNHHTEEMTAEEIKKYYRMLIFKFETGYWYFFKFFIKSLLTIDGWKKALKRIQIAFNYTFSWLKLN
ncbi:MAG: radical SAM protein, partial [Candidatus Pacebacteria bacterium]|nr:radical SAM protein [Candidatus Paceibacterota bacterium]